MHPNLEAILMAADQGYHDEGNILRVGKALPSKLEVGDGLAEFIARELVDTFDEEATVEEQIEEARRVTQNASSEMAGVFSKLNRLSEAHIRELVKLAEALRVAGG